MPLQILLLLLSLTIVILGANYLVEGSSSVARRLGVSEFIIGLTIVGIGTSMPELVVSFTGAIMGNSDISVGNVVGSNIFNVFLILGVSALMRPIDITRSNLRRDLPINVIVTSLLILLGMSYSLFGLGSGNNLSRIEGSLFLVLFIAYLIFSFKEDSPSSGSEEESSDKPIKLPLAILMIVGGLAGLIFGGKIFVESAEKIARALNVSDKFIAITILACGTSLPELMTNIVAAIKHKGQMALGNILGSNISNILLILGGSAVLHPLSFNGMNWGDLGIMLLSTVVLITAAYTNKKGKLDRLEGVIFITIFLAYMVWLFIKL